jgi:hypothetical protein
MADQLTSQNQGFDWGQGLFSLGQTALAGYFTYETAKETSNNIRKTPTANVALMVGGLLAVTLIIVLAVKK